MSSPVLSVGGGMQGTRMAVRWWPLGGLDVRYRGLAVTLAVSEVTETDEWIFGTSIKRAYRKGTPSCGAQNEWTLNEWTPTRSLLLQAKEILISPPPSHVITSHDPAPMPRASCVLPSSLPPSSVPPHLQPYTVLASSAFAENINLDIVFFFFLEKAIWILKWGRKGIYFCIIQHHNLLI